MLILDSGHGENTAGKRHQFEGFPMFYEWKFNREVVDLIFEELSPSFEIMKLVDGKDDVPLSHRVNVANRIYSECGNKGYLISIHANAGKGTGWEVFTSVGESMSDKIAEEFYNQAKECLPQFKMRIDTTDGDSDKEMNFYILKYTNCPAILTENLFMDTLKDYKFLLSKKGVETIAKLHIEAIKKVSEKYKLQ